LPDQLEHGFGARVVARLLRRLLHAFDIALNKTIVDRDILTLDEVNSRSSWPSPSDAATCC
jgi:hypothetical protein